MVASEESMRRKLELARGVMTLNQTEQWMFITKEPMRALSKATINFPKCSTAGQCLGPIDLPENGDVWQLTHGVKKKIFGEAMIRPAGPDPINPTSSQNTAGSAGEMPEKNAGLTTLSNPSPSMLHPRWHGRKSVTSPVATIGTQSVSLSCAHAMMNLRSIA